MAAFVSGPEFPFVLEFTDDVRDVSDVFRDMIQNANCVTFAFPPHRGQPAAQLLVNFGQMRYLMITADEPEDAEGLRLPALELTAITKR